jgi:UTP:GlnB (protein PII) uridylyltransferase
MTAFDALREARTTPLTSYLAAEFGHADDWAQLPDEAKQPLRKNRDSDAALMAKIRQTAKKMMAQKKSPRKILAYMADAAAEFVNRVIFDYVHTMGLGDQALAVVSAGSFGSGELFPYSDIDIQVMKSGLGNDPPRSNA